MPETLTKADIIEHLYEDFPGLFTQKKARTSVEALIEILKSTLESGEDVLISGFGKFCVQDKSARKGRNPVTGKDMVLKKRRRVKFRCSQVLRETINTNGKYSLTGK